MKHELTSTIAGEFYLAAMLSPTVSTIAGIVATDSAVSSTLTTAGTDN